MKITVKDQKGIKVVYFEGELDSISTEAAEKKLNELRHAGHQKILITFEYLEFISSAGLRVLLSAAQGLKKDGGELRVCHLNETIQKIFDVTGFSTLLRVFPNVDDALARF